MEAGRSVLTESLFFCEAADLVESPAVREAVFPRIVAEHARTVSAVLSVRQLPSLLADQPLLEQSVRSRSPCT